MNKRSIYDHIIFDCESATPKYQQLVNSVITAVQTGKLTRDTALPSLGDLSNEFGISRDTAARGYKHLREAGVIASVPGKGHYIKSTETSQLLRVLLLFNKLSAHKKIIYDSLVASLHQHATIDLYVYENNFSFFKKLLSTKKGAYTHYVSAHKKIIYDSLVASLHQHATIDLYVYENNFSFFKKLLSTKKDAYTHYVIIPHFLEGGEDAHEVINAIDKSKLILLDKLQPQVSGTFGAVYEDFEKGIYQALSQALPQLSKYDTLKIIFPKHSYFPHEVLKGFNEFCDTYTFKHKVVRDLAWESINAGEVFISLMEDDLVPLIEKIMAIGLVVGKDVGVISYNETPVKKIILDGITTVSTDFKMIGEKAAEMILTNSKEHIAVPFYLTLRSSL